jgi:hypothetical protein
VRIVLVGRYSVHSAVLAAAILLTFAPCAAQAQVSSGDASATLAYLRADYAATRAEVHGFSTGIAAVDALAAQVRSECPGVLANVPKPAPGTPPSAAAGAASEEELDAAFGAAASTEYARRRDFARTVSRLRWSSRELTRLVHTQADAEAERAAIPPPSLCADMRSWVASGYQAVSSGTERYVHLEAAISARTDGVEASIKRELVPYESQPDKRIVRRIKSLEKSALTALVKEFSAAVGKVGEALATPAPASGSQSG